MMRFALTFLVLLMVIAINLPSGFLSEYSVDPSIIVAALVALIITGLVSSQKLGVVVLVVIAAAAANAPPEIAESIGYSRDVMLAVLIGLVILPFVASRL